ncbi:MAG: hypothetical protein JSR17_01845 [Proteobacteria bacterium]|nr:hypothetical protein [Pseudomonadota bacterium]
MLAGLASEEFDYMWNTYVEGEGDFPLFNPLGSFGSQSSDSVPSSDASALSDSGALLASPCGLQEADLDAQFASLLYALGSSVQSAPQFEDQDRDEVLPSTVPCEQIDVFVAGKQAMPEFDELDLDRFFGENKQIPVETAQKTEISSSIPLDFSSDKQGLGQDEDKEKSSEKKDGTTEKNPSFTPAFKAATQGQKPKVTWVALAPRKAKEDARDKISALSRKK